MVTQLRLYTINKGKMDDFVKGWTEGVYPLHLKHGFKIDRAGVVAERNEFFWIVSYDGPGGLGRQASGLLRIAGTRRLGP